MGATLIAVNEVRFRRRARPIANYQEWCREIAGVRVGELSVAAMRSVVRRYSDAFFVSVARKHSGETGPLPASASPTVPDPLVSRQVRIGGPALTALHRTGHARVVGTPGP